MRRPILLACLAMGCCLIIGLMCLTIGIGRQEDPSTGPPAQAAASAPETYRFSVDELSDLGGYLSDLDEGRLRAAPPVEWYVEPRAKDYVTRFVFDRMRQSPLPRITIEARDADFQQPRDVNQANLREFLELFTNSLSEDTLQAVEGDLLMLVLGDVPCVAYKLNKQFRVGNRVYPAEREVLVTLSRGASTRCLWMSTRGSWRITGQMPTRWSLVFSFCSPHRLTSSSLLRAKRTRTLTTGARQVNAGKADPTPDAR